MARPSVIVFDVNETLSDMAPVASRFTDVGAPGPMAKLWFTTLLRDGFALAAAGAQEKFAHVGESVLRALLVDADIDGDLDEAVEHVMSGFAALAVHPDVSDGVRELGSKGLRLVTLTNGSTQVAEALFAQAGIRDGFERLLSVEDAGAWKPVRAAYEYAARTCGVALQEMLLVAVHPWDIDGAARAGMMTCWIDRSGAAYPPYFTAPAITISALTELAGALED
jgi:2-haloacid dehalogenase